MGTTESEHAHGRGRGGSTERISGGPARLRMLLALLAITAAAAVLAACSSSATSSAGGGSSPAAAAADSLKTATIDGVTVLTNAKGFTLYSFAPDTPTTSKCNGTCAQNWPPVPGPATAPGVTGTFGTIKRSGGSVQATFGGHPLYTFVGDTAPRAEQRQRPERGRRAVARSHHLHHRPRRQLHIGLWQRRLRVLGPARRTDK